ncbi:MAG: ATP-dependent DNA helicase RecG [Flavobacteriaceae bacterium]
MNTEVLQTPIDYLKGVGSNRAQLLRKELGVHTFQDLLNIFPNRYIDRTKFYSISELSPSSAEVQVIGQIVDIQEVGQQRGKRLAATFQDATGSMELVWFRGHKWIRQSLKTNQPYVAFGRVNQFAGRWNMAHPELELKSDYDQQRSSAMQAVYPSTETLSKNGISNRLMRKMMMQLFETSKAGFMETLPPMVMNHLQLLSKSDAIVQIHFPETNELLSKAEFRLKFEELFFLQLQLLLKNRQHKAKIKGFPFTAVGDFFNKFYSDVLPFNLTEAQKRVLKEIRSDLGTGAQMNRLLQGDVGSGKTIVAFMTMLMALDNGFQACLMAPTALLATQHYEGLQKFCQPLGIEISLLIGATKTPERRLIHEQLESGTLHILVGTHALVEDRVKFKNLGLAIIDEQHRFGVAQRSKLWHKNNIPPHVLVMTATPIPRTLAMSVYGELDSSVIDELPPGRTPIKTVHRYDSNRLKVIQFLKDEIAKGRQVYVVYPLIEESETLDYKDLMDGYDSMLRDFPRPDYQISIVHGQMKPADKAFEMERFASGATQILIATTVIEVGIDVPNASVMVIESAERFGLSQLHQLRGRVGRGAAQSYCILMTGSKLGEDSKTRIATMVRTNDGFEIAEVDLRLRGPGDLMGTQQSGVLQLKIANIVKDRAILESARHTAHRILNADPNLSQSEHFNVRETLLKMKQFKNIWNYIS